MFAEIPKTAGKLVLTNEVKNPAETNNNIKQVKFCGVEDPLGNY